MALFENYKIIDLDEAGSAILVFCLASELDELLNELTEIMSNYDIEADELCDDSFAIKIFF